MCRSGILRFWGEPMNNRKIVGIAAIAAILFYARKSYAVGTGGAPVPYTGPIDNSWYGAGGYHDPVYTENDLPPVVYDVSMDDIPREDSYGYHDPVYTEFDLPPVGLSNLTDNTGDLSDGRSNPEVDFMTEQQRVNAFLYVLRSCEHIFPDNVVNGAAYNTFFGGSTFNDMSNHPVNTGEKSGIRLPRQMCINAGIKDGVCVSTAAGAYQFTVGTWNNIRARAPRLPDFSPASQDAAAVRLLQEIGAYPKIVAGDFAGAVQVAGKRWASLPGAIGKQGQKSNAFVLARYQEGLTQGVA